MMDSNINIRVDSETNAALSANADKAVVCMPKRKFPATQSSNPAVHAARS